MFCGCRDEYKMNSEMRKVLSNTDEHFDKGTCRIPAREYVQHHTDNAGCEQLPQPDPVTIDQEIPEKTNVYSDGSLRNPRGLFWHIGGIGVWWPHRNLEEQPLTPNETKHTRHEYKEGYGMKMWNSFNGLSGSSTRCEIGAALIAMQPPVATHIGIDNKAVVDRGTELTNHHARREQ